MTMTVSKLFTATVHLLLVTDLSVIQKAAEGVNISQSAALQNTTNVKGRQKSSWKLHMASNGLILVLLKVQLLQHKLLFITFKLCQIYVDMLVYSH